MTAVTSLLADHVPFQLDSVDRIFVAGYVPELRHEGGLVCFLIELLVEAHREAKEALTDLRQLVRGIHPAILGDRGLDAALSAVVASSPIPVALVVDMPERPPAPIESTAYFVVAEALTNVAKHAGATKARVSIARA